MKKGHREIQKRNEYVWVKNIKGILGGYDKLKKKLIEAIRNKIVLKR